MYVKCVYVQCVYVYVLVRSLSRNTRWLDDLDDSGSFGGALSGILIGATAGASDLYFPPIPGKRTESTTTTSRVSE